MNVTIVVSKKDIDSLFITNYEKLITNTPIETPKVLVLHEKIDKTILDYFIEKSDSLHNSTDTYDIYNLSETNTKIVVYTNEMFCAPHGIRKLSLQFVDTKYVVFMYNDVFGYSENWLESLVDVAEKYPDYTVFQPYIYEEDGNGHNFWKELSFKRFNGKLYVNHIYDAEMKYKNPNTLDPEHQYSYLEDHCYMVNTKFAKEDWDLDEDACFAKEVRNMPLEIAYYRGKILSVYKSQVLYKKHFDICPSEFLYYCWRRSPGICYGSSKLIQYQWGFENGWDRINEYLQFPNLEKLNISSTTYAREIFLGMWIAMGFDLFNNKYISSSNLNEICNSTSLGVVSLKRSYTYPQIQKINEMDIEEYESKRNFILSNCKIEDVEREPIIKSLDPFPDMCILKVIIETEHNQVDEALLNNFSLMTKHNNKLIGYIHLRINNPDNEMYIEKVRNHLSSLQNNAKIEKYIFNKNNFKETEMKAEFDGIIEVCKWKMIEL